MKINRWTIAWAISAIIIVAGVFANIFATKDINSQFLISFGVTFFIVMMFAYMKRKNLGKPDERDKKIAKAAMAYSWYFTYVFIALLILIDVMGLTKPSVQAVLGLVFFFMLISQFALRTYYGYRGDA